jgi:hypothetical protein
MLHLSRRATALAALVLALFGTAVFTAAASANFTLNSGRVTLHPGGTTGNPPTGSWVALPSDDGGGAYFTNPNSTWTGTPDGFYTRIQPGTTGLTLGGAQLAGGIIGTSTDTFAGLPWTLISTSAPSLTFSGNATDAGTRTLTGGDLTGLRVTYNGSLFNVGTGFGPGADRIHSLTGSITGSTANPANKITLTWTTDLTEAPFATFRAHFQLVGTWHS